MLVRVRKKIKEAFEEATSNNSILLFDEADTFFKDRKYANNSWEISQVNEFLTQMEEFTGILICTTNQRRIMDPAMQRRFHILTEFKQLTKQGIKILLEKYFSDTQFSDNQIQVLYSYNSIVPGDFGTLSNRIRFIQNKNIDNNYIIQELSKMQDEKNINEEKRIGFI